jgi:hypothetical protein
LATIKYKQLQWYPDQKSIFFYTILLLFFKTVIP